MVCTVLGLAICGNSYAEIPLTLEASIVLPTNRGVDVQHWTSDSTLGWACLSGDTILYVENLGEPVQRYTIQDTNVTDFGNPVHYRAVLARLSSRANDLCAAVYSWADDYYSSDAFMILSVIDLTAGQFVGKVELSGRHSSGSGMYYSSYNREILDILPWPPPPASARDVLFTIKGDYSYEESTPGCRRDSYESNDRIYDFVIANESTSLANLGYARSASLFASSTSSAFAATHFHAYSSTVICRDDDTGNWVVTEHESWDSSYVFRYDQPSGLGLTVQVDGSVVAQQDSGETQRMIVHATERVRALDAMNGAILWEDSTIHGNLYTGVLFGSDDEQLMAFDTLTNRFAVFDAGSGEFLDSTAALPDSLLYLIKRPSHRTEIVTGSSTPEGYLVRIYGSAPVAPSGLTCRYIPDSQTIRLMWREVPGAAGYRIYSSSTSDPLTDFEGAVPAGTHVFEVAPTDNLRFFAVTAIYEER